MESEIHERRSAKDEARTPRKVGREEREGTEGGNLECEIQGDGA